MAAKVSINSIIDEVITALDGAPADEVFPFDELEVYDDSIIAHIQAIAAKLGVAEPFPLLGTWGKDGEAKAALPTVYRSGSDTCALRWGEQVLEFEGEIAKVGRISGGCLAIHTSEAILKFRLRFDADNQKKREALQDEADTCDTFGELASLLRSQVDRIDRKGLMEWCLGGAVVQVTSFSSATNKNDGSNFWSLVISDGTHTKSYSVNGSANVMVGSKFTSDGEELYLDGVKVGGNYCKLAELEIGKKYTVTKAAHAEGLYSGWDMHILDMGTCRANRKISQWLEASDNWKTVTPATPLFITPTAHRQTSDGKTQVVVDIKYGDLNPLQLLRQRRAEKAKQTATTHVAVAESGKVSLASSVNLNEIDF